MKIRSVKLNMVMSVILSVTSLLFPLITYPYVSRVLGPEGIGKVNMATSILNYFIGFSQLGIPIYGVRVCAQVRDDRYKLNKTLQELLIISIILTIGSYLVLTVCVLIIPRMYTEKKLYLVMCSTIILQTIGVEWYYKAIEEYSYITIRSIICNIISLCAVFFLITSEDDYIQYGIVCILANGLSNILNFIHIRKAVFYKQQNKLEFKRHLKPIIIIYAMSLATSVYSNLDTVMLGFIKDDVAVALYSTSIKVKTILISVITAGASVLLPRVSYYLKNKQFTEYKSICKKTFRYILVISLPTTAFFCFYSKECILLLAGSKFIDATLPMIILMLTVPIIGFTHNMGIEMLISDGKEIAVFYAAVCGAIIDFLINLFLIPPYGVMGAAIGTLAAETIVFIVEFIFLNRVQYMHGTMRGLPWVKTTIAVIISLCCTLWVKELNISIFMTLTISAGLYGISYIIIEYLFKEQIVIEIIGTIRERIYKSKKRK